MACGGGCGDSELEVERGAGSDMCGSVVEEERAPELLDCLVEFGDPALSLADEVRLPEFGWSSGWATEGDF